MPKVELSTRASYEFEGHDATVVRDSELLNSKDVIVMPNSQFIRSLYGKMLTGPITRSSAGRALSAGAAGLGVRPHRTQPLTFVWQARGLSGAKLTARERAA